MGATYRLEFGDGRKPVVLACKSRAEAARRWETDKKDPGVVRATFCDDVSCSGFTR